MSSQFIQVQLYRNDLQFSVVPYFRNSYTFEFGFILNEPAHIIDTRVGFIRRSLCKTI